MRSILQAQGSRNIALPSGKGRGGTGRGGRAGMARRGGDAQAARRPWRRGGAEAARRQGWRTDAGGHSRRGEGQGEPVARSSTRTSERFRCGGHSLHVRGAPRALRSEGRNSMQHDIASQQEAEVPSQGDFRPRPGSPRALRSSAVDVRVRFVLTWEPRRRWPQLAGIGLSAVSHP